MDNNNSNEFIKAEQRAYMKEWRAKNKDKVRKNNQNYWKKRALQKLQDTNNNDDNSSRKRKEK